ncbi:retropepsin-like aspartic protease family protein [Halocynthiibacter namhaensis]|uniref:retropepsin-like aspartic protease family protein n=1 Tax=Halocynthiibacter namhaensis TaxID=1290553 RepID=UPI000579114C|nr:TIGR02281 family clan AA aspartic protease [Halocynthiibacter namhaensis]
MSGDNIARLVYLGMLILAIGGWYVAQNRVSRGKNAQYAAIWGLIFVGAIAAVGLWEDVRRDTILKQSITDNGSIEIPRHRDGHFYARLFLDGVAVDFTIDTGATEVVLTREDARRIGLNPDELAYLGQAYTANGPVRTAATRVSEVRFEGLTDRDLQVWVNDGPMPGSLLGMRYLNRFSKIEIAQGMMRLVR